MELSTFKKQVLKKFSIIWVSLNNLEKENNKLTYYWNLLNKIMNGIENVISVIANDNFISKFYIIKKETV